MPPSENLEKEIQRLHSAVAELTLLNELALAASSSVDINQVLDIIVQKSIKAVKAEQGSIMLVTPQQDSPLKTLIRKEDYSREMEGYRVGANITGWVLKNKQPLMVADLVTDERFNLSEREIGEIRTLLCVPIVSRAQIIGVLTLTNKKTGEPFADSDLRLISILAAQSGQLIHNSQLQEQAIEKKRLEHQLDLAKNIQHDLVPQSDPKRSDLDVASFFNPAEAVGGDYFDYFDLESGKFAVVIADVSGHGPAAALVMTLVKGILHAIIPKFETPEKALKEINNILAGMIPDSMFVTAQVVVFDTNEKILYISNAGHNPPCYFSSSEKKARYIEVPGCVLNALPGFVYTCQQVAMDTNDLLFMYTDGVSEAINNASEMFGYERLKKLVAENTKKDARSTIAEVRKELELYTGDLPQADDMVMIAVKVR
jgi:serine phosphatase RsbU (regulator of sigma subunit)